MTALHRQFRTELTTKFALKDKTPNLKRYQISQANWDAFVESCQLEAFKELSEKGRTNQKKNIYPHRLGSRGYAGEKFKNKLKDALQGLADEQQASSGALSSQESTTAMSEEHFLDMAVEHRHVAWKLEEQEDAFKKGPLPVERYDDVLEKSLPNREHPGRVRGVGSHVRMKNTYKRIPSKRRSRMAGSEAKNEERIQREVAQRVAFLTRDFDDMAARLKGEMAEQTQQLVQ